ncbi:MAG: GNAT family N-acetyltransferase [Oscillospiraceae bacterium]|jgi:uncharacterized protein YdhG (YjbR/CyaY superfamily)/RimJ/RimL family protein N-acetyltransferase|nr:GNAT family N-acetyltransferase [Oscillospiraceae bacterium]
MILLRPFEDADVALLEQWLFAPHVAGWYAHPDQWLREIHARHDEFRFITHFIAVRDDVPIGFCQYYDTHFAQAHEVWHNEPHISQRAGETYSIDYLIGDPASLRKGYGKEIVRLLCEEVRKIGAQKIIVDPEADNLASNKTLEANGFVHTGDHYVLDLRHMWTCPKCHRVFDYEPPHHFCDSGAETIDQYIAAQAQTLQPRLWAVYRALKTALPDATEKISYRMPTFWQGRNLIHFAAFAHWIGLFPGGEATAVFADKLANFHTTKGGIRLLHKEPLPLALISEIAQWCWAHNAK